MSDKNELRRLIEADQDGELGPEDRARVAAALRDDPELAAEAAELRRLRDLFRAVPPVSAPGGFRAGVLDRATTRTAAAAAGASEDAADARSGFRLVRAAPWIAGLAAACLLAVMLGPWNDDGARRGEADVATADAPAAERSLVKSPEMVREDESLRRQASDRQDAARDVAVRGAPEDRVRVPRTRAAMPPEPDADAVDGRRAGGKSRAPAGASEPVATAAVDPADDAEPDEEEVAESAGTGAAAAAAAEREISDFARERDAPTAGESPAPSKAAPAPPGRGAKREAPPVPPTVTAETPAPEPAEPDGAAAFGGPGNESDGARVAAPIRRYVVFEDEAAARRFVASLRTAIEEKTAAGSKQGPVAESDAGDRESRDDGPDAPGGPTSGGADTGGPATGGGARSGSGSGRALDSGAGLAAAEGLASQAAEPRVLERVTLATTDPIVGRVFARAPRGGVFGENVSVELLERAEWSAKLRKAQEEITDLAGEGPGERGGVAGGVAGGGPGAERGTTDAPDDGPPADEPAAEGGSEQAPTAPQPSGVRRRSSVDGKDANAEIEIVVVVVPRGSLPPTARPPADGR